MNRFFSKGKYSRFFKSVLSILLLLFFVLYAKKVDYLQIIATAETHALFDECGCAEDEVGGFPKRQTILKALRKNGDIFLVDAGGFGAGELYDFYTKGRFVDSLRTIETILLMAKMNYDAVAVGDDDCLYGVKWLHAMAKKYALPLVSANIRDKNGNYLFEKYRIVHKSNITIAVTSVLIDEPLFVMNDDIKIDEPCDAISLIWKEMCDKSDFQVILAHTGEDMSRKIAMNFPECELIVNGHRKSSITAGEYLGDNSVLLQFGFQGKRLSSIQWQIKNEHFIDSSLKWIPINRKIEDDSSIILSLATGHKDSLFRQDVADLYIMSQCPYGFSALRDLLRLTEYFSGLDLRIWFIGDILDNGSMHSLRGKIEIEDEKLWLAIKYCYPRLWRSFLFIRSEEINLSTENIAIQMGMNKDLLLKWKDKFSEDALKMHYRRSNRVDAEASPSLLINNAMLKIPITFNHIAKELCKYSSVLFSDVCDSLPECFVDADCQQSGMIGLCNSDTSGVKGGNCLFLDDTSFTFTVIVADSSFEDHESSALYTTANLFPASTANVIRANSVNGKKILSKLKPQILPLYLFDTTVSECYNFEMIKNGIKRFGEWYIFKNGVMKAGYYLNRLFTKRSYLYILDGFAEQDQISSQVQAIKNDSLITVVLHNGTELIENYTNLSPAKLSELDIREPVELLIFNRELISVRNQQHLADLIDKLSVIR